jgi:hypothetical protein
LDKLDINRGLENVNEKIKTSTNKSLGLCDCKKHKPWLYENCFGFLHHGKQAKMQWLQDPNQNNVDTLNNIKREASRHFRKKENI